ncbi:MAG: acyl-CoA thioesterase [Deltaproteobacteria bacterium]|nr:acyl-CoA thioesterase [Candidatus Anaeroferrophillus wilburensis]MBN2888950.1 acyl-CoA thioesterase [Deltaproteobacteria bacterium]
MQGKTARESSVTIAHVMLPVDANPAGNVHGGVIMKLIDTTAGVVATRHARRNVVTASIDRLDFHYPAYIGNLVFFKASLNLTGRSSMEIGVRVEREDLLTGQTSHIASSYLTFVALDSNGRAVEVPPLILETGDEKRRYQEAMERSRYRQQQRQEKRRQQ